MQSNLFRQTRLLKFLTAVILLPICGFSQLSDRSDGMRFVPDVRGQFRALTHRADAMGFHIGGSPNPSACKHYQAITRVDRVDRIDREGKPEFFTPFFIATRNGNTPEIDWVPDGLACDDSPTENGNGHLIVFRMGSRDRNGERLRNNRLQKGLHVNDTPPSNLDRAVTYFTVVGGNPNDPDPAKRPGLVRNSHRDTEIVPPRVYQHPGGMQLIGNILAVVVEKPRQYGLQSDFNLCNFNPSGNAAACSRYYNYERAPDATMVMFFDVSNPENPRFLSRFVPFNGSGVLQNAGVVAVTPLPDGAYLMAVAGGNNRPMFFFRSTTNDLKSPALNWQFVGQSEDISAPEKQDHQTLQFIREGSINGRLYLAGARGKYGSNVDRLDLYRVICSTQNCLSGETVRLSAAEGIGYRGQLIEAFPNTGGTRLANLAAASGFYVSPSGELIFYATEHDNDGPNGTVKAGEWRHREIVRPDSPTLLPKVVNLEKSFQVDEGSSINLSGVAKPPITKSWIQLYHNTDYGSFYSVIDFADYELDDFNNFSALEYLPSENLSHHNKARSWKWYAPAGCSIQAFDWNGNASGVRTLDGTDFTERSADLTQVINDLATGNLSQKIDSVEFATICAVREAVPYELYWDFDGTGSYETSGSSVVFNAANVDGPATLNAAAQARHFMGGATAQSHTVITVRNVAPTVSLLSADYSTVRQFLNPVSVPYALTKNAVTVKANFTDPGVLDRQTATLNWGNGKIDAQNAFTVFNDAYGDGAGNLSHTYRYNAAGTFQIAATVRDDDGGTKTVTKTLRVLTPEQSIVQIVSWLDELIAAAAPDSIARKSMQNARLALVGSNGKDSALSFIRAGRKEEAEIFIQQAIDHLRKIGGSNANVAVLNILLEDTKAALFAN